MKIDRQIGIITMAIWIVIHFMSREYCHCCTRMCGIYTQNIWDYLYIISILGVVISSLFIIGFENIKEQIK